MDVRTIIGWNIRRIRVAQGLSQERLALGADLDRAYVGRIERGSENMTVAALESLAKALTCPVADLLIEPKKDAEPPVTMRPGRRKPSD